MANVAGPAFAALARRLALLLIAVALGTFASIGLLARGRGSIATVLLGLVLVAYGLHGLTSTQVQVDPKYERPASPVVGAVSGLLNGATGVFVVPSTLYLASLRMSKDELIQSVGMLAFTAAIALGAALWLSRPLLRDRLSRRLGAARRLYAAALTVKTVEFQQETGGGTFIE